MGNNLIYNYLNNPNNFTQSNSQSKPSERGYFTVPSVSSAMDSFDIETDKLVKPLDGKGHLVSDSITAIPREFVRDTVYTAKALADGVRGKANDHQLGKLNDLGLKVGGLAIATYLMTKKTTPMRKSMEFIGFGAFLASMALWPKIALEIPARLIHGFNFRKQYIDEQGRKKYVTQDPNYIPFDLYKGDKKSEDLDVIGDRAGISRDIPNRHEAVKEHMRKVSVQNNTLWMLTAGIATPLMTALACNQAEKVLVPYFENRGNKQNNKNIFSVSKYFNGYLNADEAKDFKKKINADSNSVKEKTDTLLSKLKGKVIQSEDITALADTLTEGFDAEMRDAAKEDIKYLISDERYVTNANKTNQLAEKLFREIKKAEHVDKDAPVKPKILGLASELTVGNIDRSISNGVLHGAIKDLMTDVAFNVLDEDPEFKNSRMSQNLKSIEFDKIDFFKDSSETAGMTESEKLLYNIKKHILKVNNSNPSEDFVAGMSELEGRNKAMFDRVMGALDKGAESVVRNFYEGNIALSEGREDFIREYLLESFETALSKKSSGKAYEPLYDVLYDKITDELSANKKTNRGFVINDKTAGVISRVAGQLKEHNGIDRMLADAAHFKVEKANETIVANNWDEVSKLFVKKLGLSNEELTAAAKDEKYSKELLAKKLSGICSNEASYKDFITSLAEKMVLLDEKLDAPIEGSDRRMMEQLEDNIAKNCDKTGSVLRECGMENMTEKMCGGDSWTVSSIKDAGSVKRTKIERLHSRVEGVHSSYMRLLQTAEFFHRADSYEKDVKSGKFDMETLAKKYGFTKDQETNKQIIEDGKKLLLDAHSAEYYNKMGLHNDKSYFEALFNAVFRPKDASKGWNEGWASSVVKDTFEVLDEVKVNGGAPRRVFDSQKTKSLGQKMLEHMNYMYNSLGSIARATCNDCEKISVGGISAEDGMAYKRFDLIGKSMNDFFRDTIKQKFNSKKWMKAFAPVLAATFAVTVGAQFFFGKKDKDVTVK